EGVGGDQGERTGPTRVTVPVLQVIDLLLAQPSRDDWFALEICRQTGLGSGTVAQILFRLRDWGWVTSSWEDATEAHRQGRRRPPLPRARIRPRGRPRGDLPTRPRTQPRARASAHGGGVAGARRRPDPTRRPLHAHGAHGGRAGRDGHLDSRPRPGGGRTGAG